MSQAADKDVSISNLLSSVRPGKMDSFSFTTIFMFLCSCERAVHLKKNLQSVLGFMEILAYFTYSQCHNPPLRGFIHLAARCSAPQ